MREDITRKRQPSSHPARPLVLGGMLWLIASGALAQPPQQQQQQQQQQHARLHDTPWPRSEIEHTIPAQTARAAPACVPQRDAALQSHYLLLSLCAVDGQAREPAHAAPRRKRTAHRPTT